MTPPNINDPIARYGFFSWLRRGVATEITRADGAAGNEPRATVTVHLGFNNDTLSVDVPLELLGSGEAASLEQFSVVRTWPRPDSPDAETNYFPLVEFRDPDLPWRLTAATENAAGRLRPWIVLIVLKEGEARFTPAQSNGIPPSVAVNSVAVLPDLRQSWAWAHVQVTNQGAKDAAAVRAAITNNPGSVVSRLLSPRKLEERTKYTAYVVPAFERGRLKGLRQDPALTDALVPAWTPGQVGGVTLPVFYHWSFYTEREGDFEELVQRLQPRMLPPEVGIRDVDVSNPRGALHAVPAHTGPLGLEGALKTTRTQTTPWPATPEKTLFSERLRKLVNTPAQMLAGSTPERVVAPPLYGSRHAAAETLQPEGPARPAWFHELNHDPRLRITSGLGTQVVQTNQRALMASAWDQVAGIRAENEARRQAQLARAASTLAWVRHVVPTATEELIALTQSLHTKVKGSPVTIRALLNDSPIPAGLLDAAWRRVARPLGALGRRQQRPAILTQPATLLDRVNRGEIVPGKLPPVPSSLPTIGGAGELATPVPQVSQLAPSMRLALLLLLLLLGVVLLLAGTAFGATGVILTLVAATVAWFALPAQLRAAVRALFAAPPPVVAPSAVQAAQDLANERFDPGVVAAVPPRPEFVLQPAAPLGAPMPPVAPAPAAPDGAADNVAAREFRGALGEMFAQLGAPVADARPMTQVNLPTLRNKLQVAIDPRTTVARPFLAHTRIDAEVGFVTNDPIDEIKAYPKFPQPMYEALKGLGQDWLLPGLELIPPNTIALLITNQRIIEAYMAGLNHEMGRELLWNEYPAELRGSYFRQFWDVRGVPTPPGNPDGLKDITEMHGWRKALGLGANSARPPLPGGEERAVLLVRGDLFRRYPNTHVYAVEATAATANDNRRNLGTKTVNYQFHGKLDPDITFFGFPLTPSQVVGAVDPRDTTVSQGYFFVLQEQPAEPRFGLDVGGNFGASVNTFDALAWNNLSANQGEHDALNYIDLDRPLPDLRPLNAGDQPAWHADAGLGRTGARAAQLASITLQKPVFIAVHGSDMLRGT